MWGVSQDIFLEDVLEQNGVEICRLEGNSMI